MKSLLADKKLRGICRGYRPDIVNLAEPKAIAIAQDTETKRKVVEWLDGDCQDHPHNFATMRSRCYDCMESLRQEALEGRTNNGTN